MATLEKLSILRAWAEVYIFAMIGNAPSPVNILRNKLMFPTQNFFPFNAFAHSEIYEVINNQGESLLSLVEPELPTLSKHWLDALKDHALLRLPCEFQCQLPQDGGTFFTTDTMNSSKSHYLLSWPSILYAASLWLNNKGFEVAILSNTLQDDFNSNKVITSISTNSNKNIFYMLFGICMEALCSTRTSENSKNVLRTLQSLYTLFSPDWSKKIMAENKCLTIELCTVLHRQILIRDDVLLQLLCVGILRQTVSSYFMNSKEKTSHETWIGEGGASGEIIPGNSIVYSVLEACLCIFVRYIPSINPSISSTNEICPKAAILNDDNCLLITSGLQCAISLLYICSPKGAVSILSTILHMTITIIKELANKSTDLRVKYDSAELQSALQCLKLVCIHKYADDEKSSNEWKQILQSSLGSVFNTSKTVNDDEGVEKMDNVTMLLTMSVFILNTGATVVAIPSLQYPCINHLIQCLQSDNKLVKLKSIQIITSIFINSSLEVSSPYVHALAPRIIEQLYCLETKNPRDDIDVSCILESIAAIETLISLVDPKNRKLLHFLLDCNNNCYY